VIPTPSATPGVCVRIRVLEEPSRGLASHRITAWKCYLYPGAITVDYAPTSSRQRISFAGAPLDHRELNVANGEDPSCIQQTIADADALIGDLVVPPVGDGCLSPRDVNALKDTLEDYNEGHLCAPSCDNNGSPTPSPSPGRTPRRPPELPHHQRPPR
jgi:hypothetical protein